MWEYNYTENMYSPDELYHYGILGMRWRHRKAQIKKYKDLRKMKKQEQNDKFQKEINSRARAFGSDHVRRGINSKAIIGAAELALAGDRFRTAKNYNFGVNGKGAMYLNAAMNTGLAARGVGNLISARNARKALNNYEYDRLKSSKNRKHK